MFQINTDVDIIPLKVLWRWLLIQLHSLLKSWAGLQLVPQTQRQLHVSWLKRGERPVSKGRERSRSGWTERRLIGKHLLVRYTAAMGQLLWEKYKTVVKFSGVSRRSREELERRRAEERAQQQAEAQRLIEEKRRREEEEQRQAEEERAQAMREAALLQKQVGNANITSINSEVNCT